MSGNSFLMVAAFFATAYALVAGIVAMATGDDVASEHWMMRRVGLQALAVLMILIASLM